MGWERKRGKLSDFNRLLREGTREPFSVVTGDTEVLRQVRYVITLDADTMLPQGAAAALIKDLKDRGLLDSTLVVWGGEFGRTPMNEERKGSRFLGRDHHPRAFTMWMAGGGIKPGVTVGRTDELGYNVVEDAVEVHDLHATILHLMGLDHTRLTYRFQGRDFRLTDVSGHAVRKLLV